MPLPNINIDLAEQEKILKHHQDLLNDEKCDWSQRLQNLRDARKELVDKYGRDGLMLLIDSETRVYVDSNTKRSLEIMHYFEMPKNCPWYQLRDLSVSEIIAQVWKPFPTDVMDALIESCKDLFVIFEAGKWYLVYPFIAKDYDDAESYEFLAGREAEPNATLSEALTDAGWKMPADLKEFYCVHGTFGDIPSVLRDDNTDAISSASKLEASLTFLEEYCEEWEVEYSFFDLLPFYEDGVGNSQNFYKADPVANTYITVDWDHETKEISGGETLKEFIEGHFSNKLRGE